MTLVLTRIDAGDGSAATSFVTGAITPAANSLVLLCIASFRTGAIPPEPTITGGMTTWTLVNTINFNTDQRISVYRAQQASVGSGAITLDFGAISIATVGWAVYEFTGAKTSGVNGADAVVQSGSNTNSLASITNTLAAFASSLNMAFGTFFHQSFSDATTPGTGFTQGRQWGVGTGVAFDEWKVNDPIVSASWANASVNGVVAMEIAENTVTLDNILPDADVTTTGWSTAPLFSKVNDASDATVITATAV